MNKEAVFNEKQTIDNIKIFQHVNYLWDDVKAAELEGDEVGLLIYR